MQRKHLIGLAIAAALVSVGVYAQQSVISRHDIIETVSPDVPVRQDAAKQAAFRSFAPVAKWSSSA
jgi:predicted RND superfamily exporter protein